MVYEEPSVLFQFWNMITGKFFVDRSYEISLPKAHGLLGTSKDSYNDSVRQFKDMVNQKVDASKSTIDIRNFKDASYSGSFKLGDQDFTAVFDTGSSNVWIPSKLCDSKTCRGKNRYDSEESKTYVDRHDDFRVRYGTGDAVCKVASDYLKIGDFSVIIDFGEATELADFFADMEYDGLFGLGYQKNALRHITPPIDELKNSQLIDNRSFSFWLTQNGDTGSTLTFGGWDSDKAAKYNSTHTNTELTTIPLLGERYFPVGVTQISYGDKTYDASSGNTILSIVDSGTSAVMINKSFMDEVGWPTNMEVSMGGNCDELAAQLKTFCVSINTKIDGHEPKQFCLTPMQYMSKTDVKENQCALMLGPQEDDYVSIILGDAFMKHYYILFDMDHHALQILNGVEQGTDSYRSFANVTNLAMSLFLTFSVSTLLF